MIYAIPIEMVEAGADAAAEHEGEIPEVIAVEVYMAMEAVRQLYGVQPEGGVQ